MVVFTLKEMPLFGDSTLHKVIPTNAVLFNSCISNIRGIRVIKEFCRRVAIVEC